MTTFILIANKDFYASPGVEDWREVRQDRLSALMAFDKLTISENDKGEHLGADDIYLVIVTSVGFKVLKRWRRGQGIVCEKGEDR